MGMQDAQAARWLEAMDMAIAESRLAPDHGDVPVGAVVLDPFGEVVATNHNRREELQDPTAHAEILVLSAAAQARGSWRLDGHVLVVTLEPCPMCAGAAVWARLGTIVYGCADPKAGAAWSLYNIPQDVRLNHHVELVAGIREADCSSILSGFFGDRR